MKINKTLCITIFTMLVLIIPTSVMAQTLGVSTFPQITVSLINNEPDPVAPGNPVTMKFRIENEGGKAAENVESRLILKYPFSLYGEEDIKSLGTIAGSQTGSVGVREDWQLLIDGNAVAGEQTVEYWYRIDGGIWTKSGDYTVTIRNTDAVLSINEIKTDRDNLIPGTMTKVSFILENMADTTLKDIKLNLGIYTQLATTTSITYKELPFTPIGSGNEKTLHNLMPGKSHEITFDLFTDADAESKVYKVPYTLTYSDNAGNEFSRTGVVGLIVEAAPDLSVNVESTEINGGQKGIIEIKLVNKGFSDIKFLDIILSETSEFKILSNPEVYIGKLDSDDYETAEYTLQVSKTAGETITLPLNVEYRDANGNLYTKNMELGVKLQMQKKSAAGIIIFIVIIIVIIVGIVLLVKRNKKRKKKT